MFFTRRSLEILHIFNTLTSKQIFWKTANFFKKLKYHFLVESTKIEKAQHFHTIMPCQMPILKQIEWGVQNGPITKNGVWRVTNLFFWKFWFSLTLSWQRPLPYRNQSIDLLCKSMDWFLYDNGLHHERVKNRL